MRPHNAPDDLDAYLSTFDEAERADLAVAETAIDLAVMLHRARQHRGLSQSAAAERSGFAQQAISRIERPGANVQVATLQKYLGALGYEIEIVVKEPNSGEIAASITLAPTPEKVSEAENRRQTQQSRIAPIAR